MVSIASELFPLPLGPQKTVMESLGISTLTDFRLCSEADSTKTCVLALDGLLFSLLIGFALGPFDDRLMPMDFANAIAV